MAHGPRYVRRDSPVFRRRRRIALAAIAAAIALAGLLAAQLGGGGEPVELRDPEAGIATQLPSDWEHSVRGGAHALESPDGCVVLALSAPAAAARSESLRESSLTALEQAFGAGAEAGADVDGPLGGLDASGATVSAGGRATAIAVARGNERAYLVQVARGREGCTEAVAGARTILGSLKLTG